MDFVGRATRGAGWAAPRRTALRARVGELRRLERAAGFAAGLIARDFFFGAALAGFFAAFALDFFFGVFLGALRLVISVPS